MLKQVSLSCKKNDSDVVQRIIVEKAITAIQTVISGLSFNPEETDDKDPKTALISHKDGISALARSNSIAKLRQMTLSLCLRSVCPDIASSNPVCKLHQKLMTEFFFIQEDD